MPLASAMKVGDEFRMASISRRDLVTAARRLSLPEDWAEERVDSIRRGVARAFADSAASVESPFATTVADSVAAFTESRGWVAE
jgi:hypothetical protein